MSRLPLQYNQNEVARAVRIRESIVILLADFLFHQKSPQLMRTLSVFVVGEAHEYAVGNCFNQRDGGEISGS